MVTSHFILMIIYFCQVFAQGINRTSNDSTVIVNLIDENDNNPTFSDPIYNYTIKKNITVGHRVGQVNLIDIYVNFTWLKDERVFIPSSEMFLSSFYLRTLGQLNHFFAGMIYGWYNQCDHLDA